MIGTRIDTARPWNWEGNVQAVVVDFLSKNGYKISQVANTAIFEKGKDIVAITPNGKTLWVSVKGWPSGTRSTRPNTQARNWFSRALFDIILYRDEDPTVELALAFPDGYTTYLNLAKRIGWFKKSTKLQIFWVSENGAIRIE